MDNIYKRYKEARNAFYIKKTWMKSDPDFLKERYTRNCLGIPCDGLVKTKEDAEKAVAFYTAFYNKLEYENKLNDGIKEAFNRTIKKYKEIIL